MKGSVRRANEKISTLNMKYKKYAALIDWLKGELVGVGGGDSSPSGKTPKGAAGGGV